MKYDTQVNGFSVLLFRVLLSGIFIIAGLGHIINPSKVTQRINAAAFKEFAYFFGDPHVLAVLSGYALLLFGLTFLLGVLTRWSAIILLILLIPITITIQVGNGIFYGPLWKNIALFGGLLFFILNNPKSYSLYHK